MRVLKVEHCGMCPYKISWRVLSGDGVPKYDWFCGMGTDGKPRDEKKIAESVRQGYDDPPIPDWCPLEMYFPPAGTEVTAWEYEPGKLLAFSETQKLGVLQEKDDPGVFTAVVVMKNGGRFWFDIPDPDDAKMLKEVWKKYCEAQGEPVEFKEAVEKAKKFMEQGDLESVNRTMGGEVKPLLDGPIDARTKPLTRDDLQKAAEQLASSHVERMADESNTIHRAIHRRMVVSGENKEE